MYHQNFNENDWKLFRQKVPEWQEAYIDRRNKEYIQLLCESAAPSDKFWRLEKQIKTDRNKAGVCLDMRRSMMIENLIQLIYEGVISFADLDGFSAELRERVRCVFRNRSDDLN